MNVQSAKVITWFSTQMFLQFQFCSNAHGLLDEVLLARPSFGYSKKCKEFWQLNKIFILPRFAFLYEKMTFVLVGNARSYKVNSKLEKSIRSKQKTEEVRSAKQVMSRQEAWVQWNKSKNNLDTGGKQNGKFAFTFSKDSSFERRNVGLTEVKLWKWFP